MMFKDLLAWSRRLAEREQGEKTTVVHHGVATIVPVRWCDVDRDVVHYRHPDRDVRLYRCTDDHVCSHADDNDGCYGCGSPVVPTFPEDVDGPPVAWQRSSVVVVRVANRYVAIRAKKHGGRLQLPGGKRHRDESPAETAARELYEETGLVIRLEGLIPIYIAPCGGFECTTFFVGMTLEDCALVSSDEGEASIFVIEDIVQDGVYPEHTLAWLGVLLEGMHFRGPVNVMPKDPT